MPAARTVHPLRTTTKGPIMTALAPPTRTASQPPPRRRRRRAPQGGALAGWLYATPTALFVLLLFVLPLLLVLQMSGSDWPLLGGNQGKQHKYCDKQPAHHEPPPPA